MLLKRFMLFLILGVFGGLNTRVRAVEPPPADTPFIVVLDAGHGGHDPGNLGNGYMEKNIALNIVLEVGRRLEREPGIKVIYTRKDDSFVDLYLRGKIANEAHADLFVSVHCDSHSSDAHGAGTFVLGLHANEQNFEIAKKENSVIYLEDDYETRYAEYDINSPESIIGLTIMQEEYLDQSIMLAKLMQDEFSGELKRNDRKVKQAGFIVLHQTFMPSVLVETGFLTNDSEGKYLNSAKGQQEMGMAIADAILTYKQNVRSQPGSLVAASTPSTVTGHTSTTAVSSTEKPDVGSPESIKNTEDKPIAESRPQKQPATSPELADKKSIPENEVPSPGQESSTQNKPADLAMATEIKKEPVISDPVEKKPVDQPLPAPGKSESANIVFKVQLMASSRDLPLRPSDFKGLGKLSKEPYKNLYRYLYGNTPSYEEAKLLKSNADLKGYTTSFIVAYKDGVRIPVEEAVEYMKD